MHYHSVQQRTFEEFLSFNHLGLADLSILKIRLTPLTWKGLQKHSWLIYNDSTTLGCSICPAYSEVKSGWSQICIPMVEADLYRLTLNHAKSSDHKASLIVSSAVSVDSLDVSLQGLTITTPSTAEPIASDSDDSIRFTMPRRRRILSADGASIADPLPGPEPIASDSDDSIMLKLPRRRRIASAEGTVTATPPASAEPIDSASDDCARSDEDAEEVITPGRTRLLRGAKTPEKREEYLKRKDTAPSPKSARSRKRTASSPPIPIWEKSAQPRKKTATKAPVIVVEPDESSDDETTSPSSVGSIQKEVVSGPANIVTKYAPFAGITKTADIIEALVNSDIPSFCRDDGPHRGQMMLKPRKFVCR